jgi:hypothetical protein
MFVAWQLCDFRDKFLTSRRIPRAGDVSYNGAPDTSHTPFAASREIR